MKKNKQILVLNLLFLSLFFISCSDDDDKGGGDEITYEEIIAVANRGAASISFVNASTNVVESTLSISNSEPMYVVYVPSKDKLYVGDRAGNKVHVVNLETKTVENTIDVGNGVFHMWADGSGNNLWVNNDTDKTTSVIDLNTNTVKKTISLGIKPHDVFVNKDGTRAYISVLSEKTEVVDSIYMYSATTFEKMAARAVGKDPHVFHLSNSNELFVPCQSGVIYKLEGNTLDEISNLPLEGTHGVFSAVDQSKLYVANIKGSQLYTINTSDNSLIGEPVATSGKTPHNIVVNEAGNKIFITHSGAAANMLSTYNVTSDGTVTADKEVVVETNPFGIAYYKREKK